jgi:hypothetical protein
MFNISAKVENFRNGTCPNGYHYSVKCPVGRTGEFNITCPSRISKPVCTTWNGENFEENVYCEVIDYDEYSTTCYCNEAFSLTNKLNSMSIFEKSFITNSG